METRGFFRLDIVELGLYVFGIAVNETDKENKIKRINDLIVSFMVATGS